MHRTLIIALLSAAAAFTGGYFAGRQKPGTSAGGSGTATGPVPVAVSGAGKAGASAAAKSGEEVTAFKPGRPFARGQAKYWILALMAKMKNIEDDPVEAMEMATEVLTMDKECAQEIAMTLREMMGAPGQEDEMKEMFQAGLGVALYRWSREDPRAVLEFVKNSPAILDEEVMSMVFMRLGSSDPGMAEQALAGMPAEQRAGAIEGLLLSMGTKDPAAALALAERHPEDAADHFGDIIEKMAAKDGRTAAETVARLIKNKTGNVQLSSAIDPWLKADPAAARAWVASYSGEGKASATSTVLAHQFQSSPAEAAATFDALTDKGDASYAPIAFNLAGHHFDTRGPAAAGAWALALPEGVVRDSGVHHIASQWSQADAGAASEWITTLPTGSARDQATESLIYAIKRREPASAFEWARSISDHNMQHRLTEQVLDTWEEQDPEAASKARTELPPSPVKATPQN